jgi:LmbE family N-acetylglucosaminyl deacetylase
MKFINKNAEIYIPDGVTEAEALKRTTHLAISAHQDDIELMAYDGILKCFGKNDKWFSAIVTTNGAGSPRTGLYADYSDEDMQKVRKLEQKKAAFVGEYSSLTLLDYTSSAVKDGKNKDVVEEFKALFKAMKPEVIYTHNLADKHDTHIGVVTKVIKALRELDKADRPKAFYGCEVWRDLDWVNDEEKVVFDVTAHPNIAASLVSLFDSQIAGGKRYDLATQGRRIANATYYASHGTDTAESLCYAVDLTPLINDDSIDVVDYIDKYIDSFKADVNARIKKVM